jgi:hypothetical protein
MADTSRRAETQGPSASDASLHVPSPELVDLLSRVKETPQVRQEVLQRVARRLASGYYSTPDAAEKTAEAIQKAGP